MTYRSMQGKEIDMDKLMRQNELTPAVGNAGVNARGDKLGPGGAIIKKREEIMAEYYQSKPSPKEREVPVTYDQPIEQKIPVVPTVKKPAVEE